MFEAIGLSLHYLCYFCLNAGPSIWWSYMGDSRLIYCATIYLFNSYLFLLYIFFLLYYVRVAHKDNIIKISVNGTERADIIGDTEYKAITYMNIIQDFPSIFS